MEDFIKLLLFLIFSTPIIFCMYYANFIDTSGNLTTKIMSVIVGTINITIFYFLIYKGLTKYTIEKINKKIELHPQNAELYIKRAEIKKRKDDILGAIEDCNIAINIEQNNPKYYFYKANLYYEMEFLKDSLAEIEKAIEIKSCLNFRKLKKVIEDILNSAPEEIAQYTQKIEKIDKDYFTKDYSNSDMVGPKEGNIAYFLYERASLEYILEDYEKAIADYKKAEEIDNFGCMFPFYKVIYAYIKMKNYDKAIEEINKLKREISKIDLKTLTDYINKLKQGNSQN